MNRYPWITLAIFTVALVGCSDTEPAETVIRPVRAVLLGNTPVLEKGGLSGRAQAAIGVDLAFRVEGTLEELPIKNAQPVEAGELIARLDPRDYQTQVSNLQAEQRRIGAELALAESELEKIINLRRRGAAADNDVDIQRATRDSLQAQLEAMDAQIEQAELDLSYTTLSAPFAGVISETYVDNFERVTKGELIARVVNISQIEMIIDMPEQYIGMMPYATDLTCEFDAYPGLRIPAKVKEIGLEQSESTRTYPVTLIMDQPEGTTILPGMSGVSRGRVDIPDNIATTGIEVPASAVFEDLKAGTSVWIVDPASETVARRSVQMVQPTPFGLRLTGIEPGEWIVTAGVSYLIDGQQVRLLDDSQGSAEDTASDGEAAQ